MALSRVHVWAVGEVLTSTALNAEFNNVINNATSLISPMTATLAMGTHIIQGIAPGSAAIPSLSWSTNAASGIYSADGNSVEFAHSGVQIFSVAGVTGNTLARFSSADTSVGPVLTFYHTGFPLNNHETGSIEFIALGNVQTTTPFLIGKHTVIRSDADEVGGMSSFHLFTTQNASASHAATQATLTAAGVWTDASLASGKDYLDEPMDGVLGRLNALQTLGVYKGKNAKEGSEKHYSATAEEFFEVFGLGTKPTTELGGIAPKDVSWLAIKAVMELEARVAQLESR